MDNDKTLQMLQKILDSLPENSPLVPYIKDGGDLALVCVLLALLLMPPDDMARIANEMMEEIVPTPTIIPADPAKEEEG